VYRETDDGWVVYQIKSFTSALRSAQWRQIRESWDTLTTHAAELGLRIAEWHLVLPLNPTEGDQRKLGELTAGASFPCCWQGQDFCDALAARHPMVVDYYLHDGREAHEKTVGDLTELLRFHTGVNGSKGGPLVAADAVPTLEALHGAINRHDPFFQYSISVESSSGSDLPPLESFVAEDGMIAAEQSISSKRLVTIKVFPRFKDALLERSVAGNITFDAEPGSVDAEAIEDFFTFGSPLSGVKVSKASLDAPGGLDALTGGEATVSIGPAASDPKDLPVFRLQLLDAQAKQAVGALDVQMESRSQGLYGEGIEFNGSSIAGAASFRLRLRSEGQVNLQYEMVDITGGDPSELLPELRFIAEFHRPNQILLGERHHRPFGPPMPVAIEPFEHPGWLEQMIEICDALATFQGLSAYSVRVPDLTEEPVGRVEQWLFDAMLIRGEILDRTWDRLSITRTPGASPINNASDEFTAVIRKPLTVEIGDLRLDLGLRQMHVHTARLAPGCDPAGERVEIVPGADPFLTCAWLPATELEAMLPWVGLHREPSDESASESVES